MDKQRARHVEARVQDKEEVVNSDKQRTVARLHDVDKFKHDLVLTIIDLLRLQGLIQVAADPFGTGRWQLPIFGSCSSSAVATALALENCSCKSRERKRIPIITWCVTS